MTHETEYDRPNTVAGLVAKHKELTQLREWHKDEIKRLSAGIDQIAAVITLFDPSAETEAAREFADKRKPPRRTGIKRFLLATLRDASEPLTSRQLAELWARECGMGEDLKTINKVRSSVSSAIKDALKQDLVECAGQTTDHGAYGPYKLWRIANP
ncbi:hypothetical protein [Hyphomonas sp. CY54-11-8]|uniref:hypothetical protein n=1 Tax=Hyphomonas sp. CY54-11-8 TaxID=1280944 RepID=UPI0004589D27|nr:hypothetical protein [Hyphomonas sp. CY54-11-8]KCZ49907.1 hypothetical protein HY17_02045 [Hyphomonas sp. CY54-11-8]